MSSTRAAIHKLAAFLRSSSSEDAAGHTEAAEGLVDSMEPGKREYCFPNELAGAIALIVTGDVRKKTVVLVTEPENTQKYKVLLEKILAVWDELGCEDVRGRHGGSKYLVCGAAEYRLLLENGILPRQRMVVYSKASQAFVYEHTAKALSEKELLAVISECDTAFSRQGSKWRKTAVRLTSEIRNLAGGIFTMTDSGVNDAVIRRNLSAITGLVKEVRKLCFDAICARDREALIYPLSDLVCKLTGFSELKAHYDVTDGDGGRVLEYKTNPMAMKRLPSSENERCGVSPRRKKRRYGPQRWEYTPESAKRPVQGGRVS